MKPARSQNPEPPMTPEEMSQCLRNLSNESKVTRQALIGNPYNPKDEPGALKLVMDMTITLNTINETMEKHAKDIQSFKDDRIRVYAYSGAITFLVGCGWAVYAAIKYGH